MYVFGRGIVDWRHVKRVEGGAVRILRVISLFGCIRREQADYMGPSGSWRSQSPADEIERQRRWENSLQLVEILSFHSTLQ